MNPRASTRHSALEESFGEEVLGVLALELDADTPWFWWNGLASHMFWESVADDIAMGFVAVR